MQCDSQCITNPLLTTCSYTGLNGGAVSSSTVHRLLHPPTIYARHGSTITVEVINPSPFEQLSMDFSSAKSVVPTDTFQAFMSAESGTLQKLSIVNLEEREAQFVARNRARKSVGRSVSRNLRQASGYLLEVRSQWIPPKPRPADLAQYPTIRMRRCARIQDGERRTCAEPVVQRVTVEGCLAQ